MKKVVFALLSSLLLSMAIWQFVLNRDSSDKQMRNFYESAKSDEVDTLWSYVSAKERTFYSMDRQSFRKFWSFVKSQVGKINTYPISPGHGGELSVGIGNRESNRSFVVTFEAYPGNFHCSNFIGHALITLASLDLEPKGTLDRTKYFYTLANWFEKNKQALNTCGIYSTDRGVSGSMSLEEAVRKFRETAVLMKGAPTARVSMPSASGR
jgi:hypothetical protein